MQDFIASYDLVVYYSILTYALVIAFVCIGLWLLKFKHRKFKLPETLPTVSVLVSCKNEERDLPTCIESLLNLDYPLDKLEIILVDDDSTDRTSEIMSSYAQDKDHIKILNTKGYETRLRAKARGISLGFEHASGEWVFITDADARTPTTWIKEMLRGVNPDIGIIGAMLSVDDDDLPGIFEKMTWAYTLPFAFGAAGFGSSFICVGPNMAVRNSLYKKFGGLSKVDFTIAEDLALFVLVTTMGGKALSHANPETTLNMKPVPSFKHLFSQHRRWLKGPYEQKLSYRIGVTITFTLSFLFSLTLLFAFFKSFTFGLGALGIKTLIDFVLFSTEKIHIRQKSFLRYAFMGSVYITVSMLWVPISVLLNKSTTWKGDGYVIKYD